MKQKSSDHPDKRRHVQVPRDAKLDTGGGPPMPAPDGRSQRDYDYTDRDKPLLPKSVEAKRLQDHPPQGKDQLRVGTAGDAGRPTKEGIYGKPIPPRGHL
jgi:hypothetical protein